MRDLIDGFAGRHRAYLAPSPSGFKGFPSFQICPPVTGVCSSPGQGKEPALPWIGRPSAVQSCLWPAGSGGRLLSQRNWGDGTFSSTLSEIKLMSWPPSACLLCKGSAPSKRLSRFLFRGVSSAQASF